MEYEQNHEHQEQDRYCALGRLWQLYEAQNKPAKPTMRVRIRRALNEARFRLHVLRHGHECW